MPGFDPEATAPVSRRSADSRPDRSVRGNPSEPSPPTANPAADHPAVATPDAEGTAAPPSPAPTSKPPTSDPSVLPDVTTDERDLGWGELPEPSDDDRYLREVPPHHGS